MIAVFAAQTAATSAQADSSVDNPEPSMTIVSEYLLLDVAVFYFLASSAPTDDVTVNYRSYYRRIDTNAEVPQDQTIRLVAKSDMVQVDVPYSIATSKTGGVSNFLYRVEITSGAGYTLGSPISAYPKQSVVGSSTPLIKISSDVSQMVEGSNPIRFNIESVPENSLNLSIVVHVSQDIGVSFIDEVLTNGIFEKVVRLNRRAGSTNFQVNTKVDGDNSQDGTITATVQARNGYLVGEVTDSVSIDVKDNGLPALSITNASDVDESGTAVFSITSNKRIIGGLDINYTPSEVDSGDFLTDSYQDVMTATKIYFYQDRANDPYIATLQIPIVDDGINENDGSISVEINEGPSPAKYTVKSTEKIASAVVKDNDIPVLAISDAPGTNDDGMAVFKIESSIETKDLNIRYTPSEVMGSNFLSDSVTQQTTGSLGFMQVDGAGPFIARLNVPLEHDSIDEPHGQIQVVLNEPADPSEYMLDPAATMAFAQVIDAEIPELTFVANESSIVEGDTATFKVTSDIQPYEPLRVYYSAETRGIDGNTAGYGFYLRYEPTLNSELLTFVADQNGVIESQFGIGTVDDNNVEHTGSINVHLEDDPKLPATYSPATSVNSESSGVSVTVQNDDLPTLSISADESEVSESAGAVWFTICLATTIKSY